MMIRKFWKHPDDLQRSPYIERGGDVLSRSFDLLNLMIYDLKRSVDLRWLFWSCATFILGGSCFFENTGETPHGQDYCLGLRDKPIPGDSSPYCWDHIRSPVPNARHQSLELLSDPGLIIVSACQSLLTHWLATLLNEYRICRICRLCKICRI